jgi:SAM-dependent methyltransferase
LSGSTANAEAYVNREVPFRFRGADYTFALSLGLFSSAGVDAGTRLLLKILSWELDTFPPGGLPRRVLDAGCGAGIIGVCAAGALAGRGPRREEGPPIRVRAQDRDALAVLVTGYNARRNGIPPETLSAHAEPLLAGPPESRWDLILSNIPAKTGRPVLADFVPRSLRLLSPGGRALLVAVNTLGDFFRTLIEQAGGRLLREAAGPGHTVFVYADGAANGTTADGTVAVAAAVSADGGGPMGNAAGADFLDEYPFYLRRRGRYRIEGVEYPLDTVHGAPLFDDPGAAVRTAAKLFAKLKDRYDAAKDGAAGPLLFHECAQGHFPRWLLACREARGEPGFPGGADPSIVLSGRNVLSLAAAARALRTAAGAPQIRVVPAVEPSPEALLPALPHALLKAGGAAAPEDGAFSLAAAFPETVPRTDRAPVLWEDFSRLLRPGGLLLVTLPSAEAAQFDRQKPAGFARSGDLRRDGFRALAYRRET